MNLDFETVRALSSPTRIKILDQVLEGESTPTSLAEDLDRSKSTISSHLDTLLDAELVEKDEEKGRKRVVYHPTRKARAIVEGRERKVRFSLTSSIVSGFLGIALIGFERFGMPQTTGMVQSADSAAMLSKNATAEAAEAAAGGAANAFEPSTVILAAGLFFAAVSVSTLLYGLALRRLG